MRVLLIAAWLVLSVNNSDAQSLNIFGSGTPVTPVDTDGSSVTLGLKFYATQPGTISSVRFYRGQQAGSSYVARLYTATGTMLGSVNVSRRLGTGWLTGTFAAPISISANTTYIAAYFSPGGHYPGDNYGLQNGASNGPLIAPADGAVGGNGVYCYGGSFCFPIQTYEASNYWVDVNFTPNLQQPYLIMSFNPTSPSVSSDTPPGTAVASANARWSDDVNGSHPFVGTYGFVAPYSNDAGTFTLSGNSVIIDPAGPGISGDSNTVQNITVQAVQ